MYGHEQQSLRGKNHLTYLLLIQTTEHGKKQSSLLSSRFLVTGALEFPTIP